MPAAEPGPACPAVIVVCWSAGPGHLDTVALAQADCQHPVVPPPGCHCGSLVSVGATISTAPADRLAAGACPPWVTLAALPCPILGRAVAALIDWFHWTVSSISTWHLGHLIAMQTGVPAKPAANVAKAGTWVQPIVLAIRTAGGAGSLVAMVQFGVVALSRNICSPSGRARGCCPPARYPGWLLLVTLWLPCFNYARSAPQVQNVVRLMNNAPWLREPGWSRGQIAAFRYHSGT